MLLEFSISGTPQYTATIHFATDLSTSGTAPGAGTTGLAYRYRKLVQIATNPDSQNGIIYAFAHWSGLGSVAGANSITFDRAGVRAASQAEIEARQATIDVATANANISTNASAIATETSARAAADTALTASINANANLLKNGGFTQGSTGWGLASGASVAVSPYWGPILVHPANTATNVSQSDWFDLNPGTYTLSADYVCIGGAGSIVYVDVLCYQSNQTTLTLDGPETWATVTQDFGGTRKSVTFTAPAGTARAVVRFVSILTATATAAQVRRIKLEYGATATAYTDENTAYQVNASVVTNASAIATVNGAAAFWETIVSASGGDLSAVRLKAGSTGSYIELISTVLRLANVSNGAVIEIMRAISGEAYFSRPISSDSASKRVTIGPGYGVSGQEVVLWFGANTVAPSSQSRTNGYFALGTDGKIYFGAVDASLIASPLTSSFSPAYVDTTHTTSTPFSQAVTVTPSGGSGTYTHVWTVGDIFSGATPTLSGQYTATCTVNVTHNAIGTIDGVIVCTTSDTVTGKQYVDYWSYYSQGTGGGGGSGGGGGRPP